MTQLQEYVSTVKMSELASDVGEPGLLYARFAQDGVYLRLHVGKTIVAPTGYPDFLSALTDGILTQISGHVLEQSHSVPYLPEGEVIPVPLRVREQAWFDSSSQTVRFRLEAEVHGRNITAEADEFDIAMDQFVASIPGQLHVCFNCGLADYMSYGGEDLRHGWHCFRDLGVDPSAWEQWWDHEDEYERAVQRVSAFHWCPSFKHRAKGP